MDKAVRYIGLAARAGCAFGGGLQTESLLKSGKAKLLIIAEDASPVSKKELKSLVRGRKTPVLTMGTRETLGNAIGKAFRSSIVITDEGLATAILKASKGTEE